MRILDTEKNLNQPGWRVLEDIDARAEAAYQRHQDLFDDPEHIRLCNLVEQTLKEHAASWDVVYHTARPATRRQAAHTEVKLGRVAFERGGLFRADAALQRLGILSEDITYKPRSLSISVRVK